MGCKVTGYQLTATLEVVMGRVISAINVYKGITDASIQWSWRWRFTRTECLKTAAWRRQLRSTIWRCHSAQKYRIWKSGYFFIVLRFGRHFCFMPRACYVCPYGRLRNSTLEVPFAVDFIAWQYYVKFPAWASRSSALSLISNHEAHCRPPQRQTKAMGARKVGPRKFQNRIRNMPSIGALHILVFGGVTLFLPYIGGGEGLPGLRAMY